VDALVTLTLLALGEPSFGRSEQLQLSHADAEPDDHAARAERGWQPRRRLQQKGTFHKRPPGPPDSVWEESDAEVATDENARTQDGSRAWPQWLVVVLVPVCLFPLMYLRKMRRWNLEMRAANAVAPLPPDTPAQDIATKPAVDFFTVYVCPASRTCALLHEGTKPFPLLTVWGPDDEITFAIHEDQVSPKNSNDAQDQTDEDTSSTNECSSDSFIDTSDDEEVEPVGTRAPSSLQERVPLEASRSLRVAGVDAQVLANQSTHEANAASVNHRVSSGDTVTMCTPRRSGAQLPPRMQPSCSSLVEVGYNGNVDSSTNSQAGLEREVQLQAFQRPLVPHLPLATLRSPRPMLMTSSPLVTPREDYIYAGHV